MKKTTVLFAVITLFLFLSCKKDSKKDCETNNYGIIKVTFLNPANQYWIGVGSRIKMEPAGITSDTLHVGPSTVTFGVLNKNTLNTTTETINVQTCKETAVNTSI